MCADGSRNLSQNPDSEFKAIQVTGSLNEDIYDLLNMSGYYVTSTNDVTKEETNYGKRSDITIKYVLSSAQEGKSAWRVVDIQEEKLNPKAEVWCLDVEEDHSFILENGIPTGNCCLFDVKNVLSGGFEMGNVWYNEPKSLDVAFDVIGDIVLSAAAQQYGGFTVPHIDEVLEPYAEKTYNRQFSKYLRLGLNEETDTYEVTGVGACTDTDIIIPLTAVITFNISNFPLPVYPLVKVILISL